MNTASDNTGGRPHHGLAGTILRKASWLGGQVLSDRALAILFLLVAAFLARSPWLHPPLSPDVRSYHISLGLWGRPVPPEQFLDGQRAVPSDSAGLLVLAVVLVGLGVVLWRPRRLGLVAGVLLAVTILANAAAAVNHPALIELFDNEFAEREQVAAVVNRSGETRASLEHRNGRIDVRLSPSGDEQRGDLARGFVYLHYGRWLLLWSAAGVLVGTAGLLSRRLGRLALWAGVGLALALVVCAPRLRAEYYWARARQAEAACDYAGARQALDSAVAIFPEFGRMERTWLLGGKVDFRAGDATPRETFFRAYQLAREKGRPRARAFGEDLPWLIPGPGDYREGLSLPPPGVVLVGNEPETPMEAGTMSRRVGMPLMTDDARRGLNWRRDRELLESKYLMAGLVSEAGEENPAVRHQAGRLLVDLGVKYYLEQAWYFPYICRDSFRENRRLVQAQESWRRAAEVVPRRRDNAFYLAVVQARTDPSRPELAEAELRPIMGRVADRVFRSEILDTLGDIYFEGGDAAEARRRYAESYDVFSMPHRFQNFRAQIGLGGQ